MENLNDGYYEYVDVKKYDDTFTIFGSKYV